VAFKHDHRGNSRVCPAVIASASEPEGLGFKYHQSMVRWPDYNIKVLST